MSNHEKVNASHPCRCAYVYIRQSTAGQVERNRESSDRQYKLFDHAVGLGWPKQQVRILDEDTAQSASRSEHRDGFNTMTAEVALGRVGIILSIEVSRVARNNSDWYRLLDLCGVTDTLIADEDGVYHPGLFNDRLLLGLKGTMAEAELHVLRARLNGGIRNKAARGELRRGLPIGFIWGEAPGEVLFHPDEAIPSAIRTVFQRFAELGSVRRVWLWFPDEGILFPSQSTPLAQIRWTAPSYTAIHEVLTSPIYAGAYTYGRTRQERYVDQSGKVRKRIRRLPRSQWQVFIPDHHEGFIDWQNYEMNQARIENNTRPRPHEAGGALREGCALLQGIATCGRCGRHPRVYYQGNNSTAGYYCANSQIAQGRAHRCPHVGGPRIEQAVAQAFLDAVEPVGIQAAIEAQTLIEADYDAAFEQWKLQIERAKYEAERAERRYRTVEPENRLVARTLEAEWNKQLSHLADAEADLARREHQRPGPLSDEQREHIRRLGSDLQRVWSAPTTTDRDRKELLRTLLEEINIRVDRADYKAHLILRWKGGLISEFDVALRHPRESVVRTDEDTAGLLRRLAAHYSDALIAGILNRQGRTTAYGPRFTANRVGNLRRHWKIPPFQPPTDAPEGEPLTITKAARILGVATSTVHRWIADGFLAAEQITPGAPWRIRITDELKERFVEQAPPGFVSMQVATRMLGVSRQTVLQRVKRGEIEAVHVRRGRRKGLLIKALDTQPSLFDAASLAEV